MKRPFNTLRCLTWTATVICMLAAAWTGPAAAQDDNDPQRPAQREPDREPRDGRDRGDGNRDGRDRGDDGDDDRDGRRRWSRDARLEFLSPEEARQVIAAVEKQNPELARKLRSNFAALLQEPPRDLTSEQIEKAFGVIADRHAELAERMRESYKEDPDRTKRMLMYQWRWLGRAIELKESNPGLYKLETVENSASWRTRKLHYEYRKAKGGGNEAEAAALKQKLHEAAIDHLKARRELRKYELTQLKDRIKEHEDEIRTDEEINAFAAKWVDDMTSDRPHGPRRDGRDGRRDNQ